MVGELYQQKKNKLCIKINVESRQKGCAMVRGQIFQQNSFTWKTIHCVWGFDSPWDRT